MAVIPLDLLASSPPPGLDLSICEREPIHIPGAIQPHGALLAALADTRVVTHASANLLDILGLRAEAALGRPLSEVIGAAAASVLQSAGPGEQKSLRQPEVQTGAEGRLLRFHAFWTGRHIGIDIEPTDPEPGQMPPVIAVQSVIDTFKHAATKVELCQLAIRGLHALTGYDRVMAYRFGEHGHGEVIAEVYASSLEPYLGNHYPTTDIPPQARRQFLRQRVGAVADSSYVPVPLLANRLLDDGTPLDLTDSRLRSVSPIHREFMRNMGTAASLSVGLVSGSDLWGFILCHNATPRVAGPDLRAAVDVIGQVVSLLLGPMSQSDQYVQQHGRHGTLRAIVDSLALPRPLLAAFAAVETEMLQLVGASGALVRVGGSLLQLGRTPPATTAEHAMALMQSQAGQDPLALDNLALLHPELADCTENGSGALLLPLGPGDDLILWFRPELLRIVTWAGDPNQHAIRVAATGQVSARTSFAAWTQVISGRSAPWTKTDLALAVDLRRAVAHDVAARAKAELAWLRHYQELSDELEQQVGQRTKQLEAETSERIKAVASLHQAQKMEAIGQLTGGIAHDFNNVLAAVLGSLELAIARISDPAVGRFLGRAQRAAERGAKLTDHLLSFARKQPLRLELCDINALINRFDDLVQRTIGAQIQIRLELADDLWPAMGDPVQFEMALLNLAVNARDAMPGGGTLVIATSNISAASPSLPDDLAPGDYTCIAVRDTGVGMSADVAAKVFEPFFTTKEIGEGTGLGLSQVFGFCKQLGGATALSSEPGIGTCVTLFLPRAEALAPASLAPPLPFDRAIPDVSPASMPARVLIVDDDPDVLDGIVDALETFGLKVISAGSGARGLEILAGSGKIDIVVTDFAMPAMNGLEFIRRAQLSQPGLPCMIVTGYAGAEVFVDAAAAGITILRKPYRMHDLKANIEHLRSRPERSDAVYH